MSLLGKFGPGLYTHGPACALPAHYSELQALCDALGHAAQLEMSEAIEREDDVARERAYGKWLGVRGILRAVEARPDEWTTDEWRDARTDRLGARAISLPWNRRLRCRSQGARPSARRLRSRSARTRLAIVPAGSCTATASNIRTRGHQLRTYLCATGATSIFPSRATTPSLSNRPENSCHAGR